MSVNDMKNAVEKNLPARDFGPVSKEIAAALGVDSGFVPTDRASGDRRLRQLVQNESWCAPLIIAGPFEVFDFTRGYDANRELTALFGIGRYDEDRVGMYEAEIFQAPQTQMEPRPESRTVHVGLDIGAAEGTPVFSPFHGVVVGADYLSAPGDYGGTLVLKANSAEEIFLLLGHLSKATVARWSKGDQIQGGELLGWLGGKKENGGWNPHLHLQVSWLRPLKTDLPGTVRVSDRDFAVRVFSNPSIVFGEVLADIG